MRIQWPNQNRNWWWWVPKKLDVTWLFFSFSVKPLQMLFSTKLPQIRQELYFQGNNCQKLLHLSANLEIRANSFRKWILSISKVIFPLHQWKMHFSIFPIHRFACCQYGLMQVRNFLAIFLFPSQRRCEAKSAEEGVPLWIFGRKLSSVRPQLVANKLYAHRLWTSHTSKNVISSPQVRLQSEF